MPSFSNVHVVLMDVEGTTTSIEFVHKTLFPYAAAHMADFIANHQTKPAVADCLAETRTTVAAETGQDPNAVDPVTALLGWIDDDRKHPALKRLQGMVWEDGYRTGGFQAPLYADVLPCLRKWHAAGKTLAIYSSGSVKAQKLLFAHTEFGDVTDVLSHYFDTGVGHKREASSYAAIAGELETAAAAILFLSDVPAELDAAKASGLQTVHVVRPGTQPGTDHPIIASFDELDLT